MYKDYGKLPHGIPSPYRERVRERVLRVGLYTSSQKQLFLAFL